MCLEANGPNQDIHIPLTNLVSPHQVQITFPDPSKNSDVVSLRGPKADVDKAYKYLTQMHQEMVGDRLIEEKQIKLN